MHYMEFLRNVDACEPAMAWLEANAGLSAQQKWEACPDGSWQAWLLGLAAVRKHLSPEAVRGLREWAIISAKRALTVHAPAALRAAARVHPMDPHKATLLQHASALEAITAPAARAAADAAGAAADARDAAGAAWAARDARDAAGAAWAAADAAGAAERRQQADDLRACLKWEWVEAALQAAGVAL